MNADELFAAALDIPDFSERAAFLERECSGDASLRAEVESLLAAHADPTALMVPAVAREGPPQIPSERSGERIGRYKLLQEIGQGGFGTVWMAEQEEPVRRRVALKIIKLGMDTREVVARFEAERQALALMDHPNIARVFDGGASESGRPYFVMELVRGVPITQFCEEQNLPIAERLGLFIQVCQAVQHAHQKGVIHRDLKPSNILVMELDGRALPKVIDFGVARATTQRLTEKTLFTRFGQLVGTPAYMSPEQAGLGGLDIDTRSDVYSLGVVLYELLVGRTPFDSRKLLEAGYEAILRTIREVEPPKPSTRLSTLSPNELSAVAQHRRAEPLKLNLLVRGELDWIVMKALEKDRNRRYVTAQGLANDLNRYLCDEAVEASPPSWTYRATKAIRRHRVVATFTAALALSLIAGSVISLWQAVRASKAGREVIRQANVADQERNQAIQARQREAEQRTLAETIAVRATENEAHARRLLYVSDMNLAQQALAANNFGRAKRLLDDHRPNPGEEDLRNWEWRYLWQDVQSDAAFVLTREAGEVMGLSFSPDGKLLASCGGAEDRARVWDVANRRLVTEIPGTERIGRPIAFSPGGDLLAVPQRESPTNGSLALLDVKTWGVVGRLQGGAGKYLAFSADGKLLATQSHIEGFPFDGSSDGSIRIFDVETKTELTVWEADHVGGNIAGVVAFSPDAKLIAVGTFHGQVRLLERKSGKERLMLPTLDSPGWGEQVLGMAFSPDGKLLATAAGYGVSPIKLWDTKTGILLNNLVGHRARVTALAFSPDGRMLASSSGDQTVRLWDVATRQQIATLRGHTEEVLALVFAPDGKTLASGGADGSIQIWEAAASRSRASFTLLPPHSFGTNCFSYDLKFTPDGRSYAVEPGDGAIHFYDTATGTLKERFLLANLFGEELTNSPYRPVFLPRGELLLLLTTNPNALGAGREGTTLKIYDFTRRSVVTNIVMEGSGEIVSLSTSRKTLAVLLYSRSPEFRPSVKLFDTTSWAERCSLVLKPQARPDCTASFDDTKLACGQQNGFVDVYEIPSGRSLTSFLAHNGEWGQIAFSPDGKVMATCSQNGEAKLWNTTTWREEHLLRGHLLSVMSIAFSPDGRRLAAASNGKEAVKLWDVATGHEVATLESEAAFFQEVEFSADGRAIAARTLFNNVVHLWRAPTWPEIEAAEGLRAEEASPVQRGGPSRGAADSSSPVQSAK